MGLQVAGNNGEDDSPELLQLPGAHADDPGQFLLADGVVARHLPQRHIREQNVRRHSPFVGKLLAQPDEALEEQLIAGDLPNPALLRCRRGHGPDQRDRFALLEHGQAVVCEAQHREALTWHVPHQAQPDQLPPDGLPLRAAVLLPNAVSGEPLVAPLADGFGLGAGQHLDDLIHPELETALLPDTVDAREELLRRQRAVVGVARREAVVAPAAAFLANLLAEIPQQFAAPAAG